MSYERVGLSHRRRFRRRRVASRLHSIAVQERERGLSGLGLSLRRPKALRKLTIRKVAKAVVAPIAKIAAFRLLPSAILNRGVRKEVMGATVRALPFVPYGKVASLIPGGQRAVEAAADIRGRVRQLTPLVPGGLLPESVSPAEQIPAPSSGGGGAPDEAEPSDTSTPSSGPQQGAGLLGPGLAIVAGLVVAGLALGAKRR